MKMEYDFSNAEKCKFYNMDTDYHFPVYLDPDNNEYFKHLAYKRKKDINVIVNEVLKKNIQMSKNLPL